MMGDTEAQPHPSRLLRVDPEDPNRWWTRFVFGHVVIVLIWIAASLIFTRDVDHRYTAVAPPAPKPGQPRIHPPSSLGEIHHLLPIPWPAWGAAFLLLAVALCFQRFRAVAYFIGFVISIGFVSIVVAYTYVTGNSTNQIVVPFATLAPDALFAGFRYSRLPPINARPVKR